jgi:hypothetical protein
MLLTPAEVERLTGYKLPAYQSKWLTQERIRHYRNRRGEVVVTWDAVNGGRPRERREEKAMTFSFERG